VKATDGGFRLKFLEKFKAKGFVHLTKEE